MPEALKLRLIQRVKDMDRCERATERDGIEDPEVDVFVDDMAGCDPFWDEPPTVRMPQKVRARRHTR